MRGISLWWVAWSHFSAGACAGGGGREPAGGHKSRGLSLILLLNDMGLPTAGSDCCTQVTSDCEVRIWTGMSTRLDARGDTPQISANDV